VVTLPLVVFSRVRLEPNPEMNAPATRFITAVTIGVNVVNQMLIAHERCGVADLKAVFAAARAGSRRHETAGSGCARRLDGRQDRHSLALRANAL